MTIESNIGKAVYTGNGSTTVFPFLFKAWKPEEIQVVMMTAAEPETEVDVTDDVTIAISDTELGGTVTFATAPATGDKIAILRDMSFLQGDRYPANTRFDPQVIEEAFDRACSERQQLLEQVGRAITVSPASSRTPREYSDDFFEAADQVRADATQVAADRAAVETAVDGFDDHVDDAKDDISALATEKLSAINTAGNAQVGNVNTAGTTQVSNVNSAGSTQTGLVNSAGSTQVSAVNGAGNTQVAAVNAAGATQVGLVEDEGDDQTDRVEDAGDAKISAINAAYAEYMAHYNALTSLTTTMSEATSAPGSVSIDWTTNTLNFAVPRGPAGSQGPQGPAGDITTALDAVYLNFEIDNNGFLILHTTDVSAATFAFNSNGEIVMTY